MSWNDFKMPHTVPNKPMNGASEPIVPSIHSPRRISEIASGGEGCTPVPLRHHIQGSELLLAQNDVISGWRLFH